MRLEYKFERISNDPDEINRVLETDSAWGWQVVNLQVIDRKNVYQGNTFGVVTQYGSFSTTEMVHDHTAYVNITYSRDVDEPRYQRWCALEEEYKRYKEMVKRRSKRILERCDAMGKKMAEFGCILFIVLMLICLGFGFSIENDIVIPIFVLVAIVCGILAIVNALSGRRYAEKIRDNDKEYVQLVVEVHKSIIPKQKQLIDEGLNL